MTPVVALAITLSITLLAWFIASSFVNGLAVQKFEDEVTQAVLSINKRMEEYEQVLLGAKAFYAASNSVDRGVDNVRARPVCPAAVPRHPGRGILSADGA